MFKPVDAYVVNARTCSTRMGQVTVAVSRRRAYAEDIHEWSRWLFAPLSVDVLRIEVEG